MLIQLAIIVCHVIKQLCTLGKVADQLFAVLFKLRFVFLKLVL